MVTQYISTRPILDLCKAEERNRGERLGLRWWENSGIDLEGARKMVVVETDKDRLKE